MPPGPSLPLRLSLQRPSWAGASPKVAPDLRGYSRPQKLFSIDEWDEGVADGAAMPGPVVSVTEALAGATPARPPLRRSRPEPARASLPPQRALERDCAASLLRLQDDLLLDWPEAPTDSDEITHALQAFTKLEMYRRFGFGSDPELLAEALSARAQVASWQWARQHAWLEGRMGALLSLLTGILEPSFGDRVASCVSLLAADNVARMLDPGWVADVDVADLPFPLELAEREVEAALARARQHMADPAASFAADDAALVTWFDDAHAATSLSRLERRVDDIIADAAAAGD